MTFVNNTNKNGGKGIKAGEKHNGNPSTAGACTPCRQCLPATSSCEAKQQPPTLYRSFNASCQDFKRELKRAEDEDPDCEGDTDIAECAATATTYNNIININKSNKNDNDDDDDSKKHKLGGETQN